MPASGTRPRPWRSRRWRRARARPRTGWRRGGSAAPGLSDGLGHAASPMVSVIRAERLAWPLDSKRMPRAGSPPVDPTDSLYSRTGVVMSIDLQPEIDVERPSHPGTSRVSRVPPRRPHEIGTNRRSGLFLRQLSSLVGPAEEHDRPPVPVPGRHGGPREPHLPPCLRLALDPARVRVVERSSRRRDAVLGLEPVLARPRTAAGRRRRGSGRARAPVGGEEQLDRALLGELLEPLLSCLRLQRIGEHAARAKCSGEKRGMPLERDGAPLAERVADARRSPGSYRPMMSPGVGLVDRRRAPAPGTAAARAQADRACRCATWCTLHAALEACPSRRARRRCGRGARVHVRLDLEDEAGEVGVVGRRRPRRSRSRAARRRRQARRSASRNGSTPKLVMRAAEEHRRQLAGEEALRGRTASPAVVQQLDLVAQLRRRRSSPSSLARASGRRGRRPSTGAGCAPSPRCARSACTLRVAAVVDARGSSARRRSASSSGSTAMPSTRSISSSSSSGSRAGAVHLVDEGEDRDAAHAADLEQLAASAARRPCALSMSMTAQSAAASVR